MKRLISLFLSIILLLSCVIINVSAKNDGSICKTYIEYLDDGSYYVTEIRELASKASGTKSGSKSKSYMDSNGNTLWTVTISGAFTYNGSSATCDAAVPSSQIFDNSWRVTSAVGTKSGNKAIGTFTVKKYTLGIPVKTVNETVTLTCSANGTLS